MSLDDFSFDDIVKDTLGEEADAIEDEQYFSDDVDADPVQPEAKQDNVEQNAQPDQQQPQPDQQQQPQQRQDLQPKQPEQEQKLKPGIRQLQDGRFVNEKNDIVDKDGNIIATAGAMRRMHDTLERGRRQVDELTRINQQQAAALEQHKEISSLAQAGNLMPDEVKQAIAMASMVKGGKVVEVAKMMVARAMAEGHNATTILGEEVGDSVDMQALRQMLKPITDNMSRQQEETAQQTEAKRAYTEFVAQHPYSDVHADTIAGLMKSNRMHPTEAYKTLRRYAAERGFDFSQPLGPQAEARLQEQQKQEQLVNQEPGNFTPANQPQPPVPSGRANNPQGGQQQQPQYANVDDGYSDIIRSVMQSTM